MTITQEFLKRSLTLNIENGMTAAGTPKTKARTYSGIREDATADNIHKAGEALGGLMKNTVQSMNVTEKAEIAESL